MRLIIVFLLLSSCFSYGQLDSLKSLRDQAHLGDVLCTYYSLQSDIEDFYARHKDFVAVENDAEIYDFLPKDSADSLCYRKALMLHGYMLRKHVGDIPSSLTYYQRAHNQLRDKDRLDDLAWFTEKAMSSIYARLDNYDKGILYAKKVEKWLIDKNDEGKLGRLYSDLGNLYKWNGNVSQATHYFKKGLDIGERTRNKKAVIANLVAIAKIRLKNNDLEEFRNYYSRIDSMLTGLEENSNNIDRRTEVIVLYADYNGRVGNKELQEKLLLSAIDLYKSRYKGERVREIAKVYYSLSGNSLEEERISEAEQYNRLGINYILPSQGVNQLPDEHQLVSENTLVDLLINRSDILYNKYLKTENQETIDSADLCLKFAWKANSLLKENLIIDDSKSLSIQLNKSILSKRLDLLYSSFISFKDEKYLREIDTIMIRSKAYLLDESIKIKNAIKNQSKQFRDSLMQHQSKLLKALDKQVHNRKGSSRDSLSQEILALKDLIGVKKKILNLEFQHQLLISPYVEYFWGDEYLYVYDNISAERIHRIGETGTIQKIIKKFHSAINDFDEVRLNEFSDQLSEILFEKVKDHTGRITIIPDGLLATIPWDLLSIGSKKLFEIEYDLVYLRYIDKNREEASYNNVLCIVPDYGDNKGAISDRRMSGPLQYAASEIEAIADLNFTSFYNTSAINLYEWGVSKAEILHFAGHASGRNSSPHLLATDTLGYQITITDKQLSGFDLPFDLVVLSACETGLGKFSAGDGVRSLAYAFHYAGAKDVVHSLWEVNDMSTSQLMSFFYYYLKNDFSPTESLKKAKIKFLEHATPEQKDPYYWAGFVCSTITHNEESSEQLFYSILCLGIVLFSYLIYTKISNQ